MSGLPGSFTHPFESLNTAVDEVHALFDTWAERGTYAALLDDFGLHVMRLAVHEWLANLVQHADFEERVPQISLLLSADEEGLYCTIEDNSSGFDFERQVREQASSVGDIAPGERGRGLLMMIACTDDLQYQVSGDGRQRLSFVLRPPVEPDDLAPLFAATNEPNPLDLTSFDGDGSDAWQVPGLDPGAASAPASHPAEPTP